MQSTVFQSRSWWTASAAAARTGPVATATAVRPREAGRAPEDEPRRGDQEQERGQGRGERPGPSVPGDPLREAARHGAAREVCQARGEEVTGKKRVVAALHDRDRQRGDGRRGENPH
jgi:hypothetical protein